MISRHAVAPRADVDIDELVLYLAQENPELALRFYDHIDATIDRLKQWPGMGRSCDEVATHLSELRVHSVEGFPNHRIYYVVRDDVLVVVRVLHSARDRDRLLTQHDLD